MRMWWSIKSKAELSIQQTKKGNLAAVNSSQTKVKAAMSPMSHFYGNTAAATELIVVSL